MIDWGATWLGVMAGLILASVGWAIFAAKMLAEHEAALLTAYDFGRKVGDGSMSMDEGLHAVGECRDCDDLRRALGGDWGP